jgi:hypothetical protein
MLHPHAATSEDNSQCAHVDIQCAHWISSEHTKRVPSVLPYCKEVLQYCTPEHCSTSTNLLLLCSTTCITSVPQGRAKCPVDPHARRWPKREAKGQEPTAAGHGDCGAILAGAAVSPPGPQRIIAQMLRACGIQTDTSRSQHYYSCMNITQYEYAKESSLFSVLTGYPECTLGFVCSLGVTYYIYIGIYIWYTMYIQ